MSENAAILVVDISNMYSCISKKYGNRKLDYAKLYDSAANFGFLRRAIAYGSATGNEAINFITCLTRIGYETKYKKPKPEERKIGLRADWSVALSMDVVKAVLAHRLDAVLIGTSDNDVIPLLQWIREQGTRCIIVGCGLTRDLKEVADAFIEINEEYLEEPKFEPVPS
jgi:uncharacterized LabA/DUF88 family protein